RAGAQPLGGPPVLGPRHRDQLRGGPARQALAGHVALADDGQQVELGQGAAADAVRHDAVELGQHGHVRQHVLRVPAAAVAHGRAVRHQRAELAQARRRPLQALDQRPPVVIDQLVHETGQVRVPEAGALDLHGRTLAAMCYSDDASPPPPPVGGAAADHGDLHVTAADGARPMAYFARAERPTGAGMVILPDVRGLHGFYRDLARRFADAGIDAVAIDYFARTAGDGPRDEGFEFRPHVQQTTPEGVAADVRAAVELLRSGQMGDVRAVFTVG